MSISQLCSAHVKRSSHVRVRVRVRRARAGDGEPGGPAGGARGGPDGGDGEPLGCRALHAAVPHRRHGDARATRGACTLYSVARAPVTSMLVHEVEVEVGVEVDVDVERVRAGGRRDNAARRAALGRLLPPAVRRRRLAVRAALRPRRRRARRAQRAVCERHPHST